MSRRTLALLLGSVGLVSACRETPADVESSATVEAPLSTIDLPPGGSHFVLFEVRRMGTHDAPVTFSVLSAPPGITARFERTTVQGIVPTTPLHIAVGTTVAPGAHTILTQATGVGVATKTITVTVNVTRPGVELSVSSASVSVEQLRSVSIPVSIERTGMYAGPVGISVSGLPPGVTAIFDRASIPAGATTATISLHATLLTPPGPKPISVTATGVGGFSASIPVSLNVLATTVPAVQLEPSASIPLAQGNTSEITIHVKRHAGYSGPVHFAIGPLPPLVTATIDPVTTSGSSTTLRVSTDPNAAVGSFPIEVTATGEGIAPATTTVSLQVTNRPGIRLGLPTTVVRVPQGGVVGGGLFIYATRLGGYDGPITVEVEGLPAGVTTDPVLHNFTFPAQAASQSMQFNYVAAPTATPGPATLTFRARGVGVPDTVTTTPILVETMGSYQLQLSPASMTISRGQQASTSITVARNGGYNGTVAFSLANAPAGITASFTPPSTAANAAQMTVHVAPTVTPGSYLMFVRGQNPGSTDVEQPVTVVVTN